MRQVLLAIHGFNIKLSIQASYMFKPLIHHSYHPFIVTRFFAITSATIFALFQHAQT